MKDFSNLQRGDIVRNIGSGESYVVDANYGDYCIAMRSVHMSNPSEWCAPLKEVEQRADNTGSPKLRENIIERLEAVQCIVASACSKEEAHCAWEELDYCIAQLRAGA